MKKPPKTKFAMLDWERALKQPFPKRPNYELLEEWRCELLRQLDIVTICGDEDDTDLDTFAEEHIQPIADRLKLITTRWPKAKASALNEGRIQWVYNHPCDACGADRKTEAKYCFACGAKLQEAEPL